jgi:hypothetical protein
MAGLGDHAIYALESTGNDSYQEIWALDMPFFVNVTTLIYAGDLDGDGRKEFLAGNAGMFLFEAVPGGGVVDVAFFGGGSIQSSAAVVDIDGDGNKEIIRTFQGESGIRIYRNTGDNTWEVIWEGTDPDFEIRGIGAGDHDQDGKAELIFSKLDSTVIYEIDPADAADMDGDGVVDAIDTCPTIWNLSQRDSDDDGVGNVCDNCIYGPNPTQGPAPLGQTVTATDAQTFSWADPAEVIYARGDLAGVASYAVNQTQALGLVTSFTDSSVPAVGAGYYYLFRPDCAVGSWQTTPGAEPGRDTTLP